MKTLTTIFISLISLISTTAAAKENSSNPEITSTTVISTTALTAGNNENTVVLNWSAKNQASNSRFEIERSFYSNNFNTIATMQIALANNSNNYRISDNASELAGRAIAYYRVKQIDANGNITYSNTMVVNLQDAKNINTQSANATQKTTAIHFAAPQNGNAVIKIQSLSGKTVAVKNTIISRGNNTVELENTNGLPKGIYLSEVSVNGVVVDNQKLIIE